MTTTVASLPRAENRILPYRWELLLWLWGAFFLNQADRQVFGTVLPKIKGDLGLTDIEAGLIASIFTLVLAVMVPIAGYAGDILNRKTIVTGSVFGWSLATVLTGLGSSVAYLIVVRSAGTAVGEACYAPSANALIAEYHGRTRARAMAIHQSALYLGVIASGWLAGMIAEYFGWRASFWIFGAGGMFLAAVMGLRLRASAVTARAERPAGQEVASALMRPTVILISAGFGCMVFVNVGYLTWMPTYLHDRFSLGLGQAGYDSMFYHHAAALVGVAVGGGLSDRLARIKPQARLWLQAGALLAGAPFLWLMGSRPELSLVMAALAGFGLFRGIYDAGIYASLFEVVEPRLRSTVAGLVIAIAYATGAIAPLALGILKGRAGLSSGFSLLAVVYLVGAGALAAAACYAFDSDYQKARIRAGGAWDDRIFSVAHE